MIRDAKQSEQQTSASALARLWQIAPALVAVAAILVVIAVWYLYLIHYIVRFPVAIYITLMTIASVIVWNRYNAQVLQLTQAVKQLQTTEEELNQSEERLRLLLRSVQDYAILSLDPEGHIVTWNEGAERIKGYKAEEIIGQHFSCFYPPEDVASGKPEMELKSAVAKGRLEDEGWRVRKDGSRFWGECHHNSP